MDKSVSLSTRLEQYTLKFPQEVLLIQIEVAGRPDQILIFKGFSSSLMAPTAFDPDVPVLPADAKICQVDRLQAPYRPDRPQYIEQGLTREAIEARLEAMGL